MMDDDLSFCFVDCFFIGWRDDSLRLTPFLAQDFRARRWRDARAHSAPLTFYSPLTKTLTHHQQQQQQQPSLFSLLLLCSLY
jgi:hypothetical protein